MKKPPERNESPLEALNGTLPAACFHPYLQELRVRLKVKRKTSFARIGARISFSWKMSKEKALFAIHPRSSERGILAFSGKLTISPVKTQRNQGHSESAQWKVFRMPKAFQFVRLTVKMAQHCLSWIGLDRQLCRSVLRTVTEVFIGISIRHSDRNPFRVNKLILSETASDDSCPWRFFLAPRGCQRLP
jgi:hypothetical protein